MFKLFTRITGIALLFASLQLTADAQNRTCPSWEHELALRAKNPKRAAQFEAYQQKVQDYMKSPAAQRSQGVITIPIVVHVVYNTTAQNISDAQVFSQIEVLNADFARMNADTTNTPVAFRPVAASAGIQFCMAQVDPNGNPTNGIERRNSSTTSWIDDDLVKSFATGGMDAWDPSQYFNVWVCNMSNGILGYAEFPTASLSNTYGVVIQYDSYGNTGTVSPPYHLGRTATHEIGHCLNLRHIWGDANCGNDFVNDTPTQQTANGGCPSYPHVTCSNGPNGDMFMNYMDYVNDNCMNTFTAGQVTRMLPILANAPYNSLVTSTACQGGTVVNNDASILDVVNPTGTICGSGVAGEVILKNAGANALTSVDINYWLDGNSPATYHWTGNLASFASVTVTLPVLAATAGSHTFNASTVLPNGVTDNNPGNDQDASSFSLGDGLPLPYSEGFETVFPPVGGSINNPDGLTTWVTTTNAAKTGIHSMDMDNYNYQAAGQVDDLILPAVDLTTQVLPGLSFQLSYRLYTNPTSVPNYSDTLEILLSTDCGLTYTSIYKKWLTALATTTPNWTADEFIPVANQWRYEFVDLSAYSSANNAVIVFRNINDYENHLYIDDINIVGSSALNETLGGTNVSVYPNPVTNMMNIRLDGKAHGAVSVELFDAQGRLVYSSTAKANDQLITIPTAVQAKGVYVLKLKNDAGTLSRRIVKQ